MHALRPPKPGGFSELDACAARQHPQVSFAAQSTALPRSQDVHFIWGCIWGLGLRLGFAASPQRIRLAPALRNALPRRIHSPCIRLGLHSRPAKSSAMLSAPGRERRAKSRAPLPCCAAPTLVMSPQMWRAPQSEATATPPGRCAGKPACKPHMACHVALPHARPASFTRCVRVAQQQLLVAHPVRRRAAGPAQVRAAAWAWRRRAAPRAPTRAPCRRCWSGTRSCCRASRARRRSRWATRSGARVAARFSSPSRLRSRAAFARPAFLAFPDLLTRFRPEDVEFHLSPSCGALGAPRRLRLQLVRLAPRLTRRRGAVSRNAQTFHFQKLLLHTATLLLQAARSASAPLPASAVNAVRFVTVLLKFASEHLTVERLLELLAEPPTGAMDGAPAAARLPAPRRSNPDRPRRRGARRRHAGALRGHGAGVHRLCTGHVRCPRAACALRRR